MTDADKNAVRSLLVSLVAGAVGKIDSLRWYALYSDASEVVSGGCKPRQRDPKMTDKRVIAGMRALARLGDVVTVAEQVDYCVGMGRFLLYADPPVSPEVVSETLHAMEYIKNDVTRRIGR